MIGRRSPRYDTLDRVLKRLDRIFDVITAMERITVNVIAAH